MEWQVNPPTGFKHKVTDNLQRFVYDVLINFDTINNFELRVLIFFELWWWV